MTMVLLLQMSAASFAATVIYVQTIGGLIYQSTDSAQTWQPVRVPIPSDDGLSLGGKAWAEATSGPISLPPIAVDPTASNVIYVDGGHERSTDSGVTWSIFIADPLKEGTVSESRARGDVHDATPVRSTAKSQ